VPWTDFLGKLAKGFAPDTPESKYQSGEYGAQLGEAMLAKWFPQPKGEMSWEESWKIRDQAVATTKRSLETMSWHPLDALENMFGGVPAPSGPSASELAFQNYQFPEGGGRRRHRRINPTNVRAARRAVARLRGTMKLLHRIESLLPKRRAAGKRSGWFHKGRHRRR